MSWLITGSNGQLGKAFHRALFDQKNICFVDRTNCDLSDPTSLANCLQREKPKVIVNCAAYTAVDAAEDDEQTAMRVNAFAVGEMARWSADNGALMVHFSTDYVFDGSSEDAYRESDTVNPLTAYGRSKAAGEELLFNAGGAALCLRTSWVHSNEGHNFLRTMRRLISEQNKLGVVNDQFGVPTTTDFLVKMTRQLIANFSKSESGLPQLIHAVPTGHTSWFGFARHIREMLAVNKETTSLAEVYAIPSEDFPQRAKRPANSILSNQLLESLLGEQVGTWQEWHNKLMEGEE